MKPILIPIGFPFVMIEIYLNDEFGKDFKDFSLCGWGRRYDFKGILVRPSEIFKPDD